METLKQGLTALENAIDTTNVFAGFACVVGIIAAAFLIKEIKLYLNK